MYKLRPPDIDKFVPLSIVFFARRDDFVRELLRLALSVSEGTVDAAVHLMRLRLAAMWGRLAACGRLSIGLFAMKRKLREAD